MKNLDAEKTTLAELISGNISILDKEFNQEETDRQNITFSIPPYQRYYAWKKENINNLWDDLTDPDLPLEESYFIGTVVLNKEVLIDTNSLEITDGQQRLFNLTILLALIRDLFLELKEEKLAALIQSNFIANESLSGHTTSYKFVPGESIRDFFKAFIQAKPGMTLRLCRDFAAVSKGRKTVGKEITKEQKLVVDNVQQLLARIEDHPRWKIKAAGKYDSRVISGNRALLEEVRDRIAKLEVVVMVVGDDEDAFTLFESINARGQELLVSDVLKNLFFKKLSKQARTDIAPRWEKIRANLRKDESEWDIAKFIRHYWLSKYKFASERKLYGEIKSEFDGRDYSDLLSDLEHNSVLYRALLYPDVHPWRTTTKDAAVILRNIRAMPDVSQPNSILLAIIRLMSSSDTNAPSLLNAMRWIEMFTFSFILIAGKSPASLERMYSRYAIRLTNAKSSTEIGSIATDFKEDIRKNYPEKNEFVSNFPSLKYSQKNINLLRYVFHKLNFGDSSELSYGDVTVEHILPQKPSKHWGVSSKDVAPFVHNVGNLTMIFHKLNQKAQSDTIDDKVLLYKESKLPINEELVRLLSGAARWDEDAIELRGKRLANKAWDVWGDHQL